MYKLKRNNNLFLFISKFDMGLWVTKNFIGLELGYGPRQTVKSTKYGAPFKQTQFSVSKIFSKIP